MGAGLGPREGDSVWVCYGRISQFYIGGYNYAWIYIYNEHDFFSVEWLIIVSFISKFGINVFSTRAILWVIINIRNYLAIYWRL